MKSDTSRISVTVWKSKQHKIFLIFVLSFVLNAIWENAHSFLYAGYRGGVITEFILLRASVADAVIVTLITLPFVLWPHLRKRSWVTIMIGILISIGIEWFALGTARWAYNPSMPIIPILNVGLTPTVQLGLLGCLSYWIVVERRKNLVR